jgi:hypothetical protein
MWIPKMMELRRGTSFVQRVDSSRSGIVVTINSIRHVAPASVLGGSITPWRAGRVSKETVMTSSSSSSSFLSLHLGGGELGCHNRANSLDPKPE